jgi:tRNA-splicing ligase RtcB
VDIIAESRYRFVIPRHGRTLVPGVVFASRALIPDPAGDYALEQVVNVAELPGIGVASYAMPGVGFDIACGVRLLAAGLSRDDLLPVLGRVMDQLAAVIPRGAGRGGPWDLHGRAENGPARPGSVRGLWLRRKRRHRPGQQLGGGSRAAPGRQPGLGNHFLEVQAVQQVYDPAAAEAFGLAEGQACAMIHCGSRGLGHQVCTDQVQIMHTAMARYGITVPDRQLACAPAGSPQGRRTWAPRAPPRTTRGPTGRCSPSRPARSSPAPRARRWTSPRGVVEKRPRGLPM